jgi:hypothetical protein
MATPKKKPAKPAKKKAAPKAKAKPKPKPAPKAKAKAKAKAAKRPSTRPPASLRTSGKTPRARTNEVERDRARLLRDGEMLGTTSIALHTIGHLELPSGTIVTCDPFIVEGPALARTVAPGTYPVTLSVATFDKATQKGDQRVAAATVHFREGTPVRWEVAAFAETPIKRGTEPGYPVDAGTACFMDAGAQASIKAEPTVWPTASQKALEQQLLTDNYRHTWGWAVYRPDAASKANCVAFMSGYGDGIYSSYWGLDERGAPICLTTDFEVFTDEDWSGSNVN